LLYQSGGQFKEVDAWSPDGRFLVFEQADPVTGWDLWLLPLEGERKPIPYLRTPFNETGASLSPDGRWMAYCSDATGRLEVYVRSFPEAGAEHLITNAGGINSSWSKDGKELLVMNSTGDNVAWAVPVSTLPTFKPGTPRFLFKPQLDTLWITATPDGDRFLQLIPTGEAEPTTIAVDLNWPAQLGR
jgi:dipeptidyl aminopeptidase/acylaminoacyl peptidase